MPAAPVLSVVLCAHNPRADFLTRTLGALRGQNFPAGLWELVVVDNASTPSLGGRTDLAGFTAARIVDEPCLGLTPARLRGIAASRGSAVVLVDDDNALSPDYLTQAAALLSRDSRVGVAGGRVRASLEQPAPPWTREFLGNLAIADHGPVPLLAEPWEGPTRVYPSFAPVGAGLIARRAVLETYTASVTADPSRQALDRRGRALASGGDNDIVMTALAAGWHAAYEPRLQLAHLIPPSRLTRRYLARLNYAISRSWIAVLRRHGACPWPAVPAWSVPLRQARAFLRHQAWRSPAHHVRWRAACGHFAGLADP